MKNGNLCSYLRQTANSINWNQRLNDIYYHIFNGLNIIHKKGLIHKDLHPGNILNDDLEFTISDFGFCMPLYETSTRKVYGVMPYMAPEILRGKPHTLASDIYSLGVIINEIMTVVPPFNDQPHNHYLALDICRGLRPHIKTGTPEFLKELIKKCWDANPEKRPTSKEIYGTLLDHMYNDETLEELSYNVDELTNIIHQTHPQAIYTSRSLNFPDLPEPINCPNQQEFVSSRECLDCRLDLTKN